MKKTVSAVVIVLLALGFVILANIIFNEPPALTEEYINGEVLTGVESIDKILFTSKGENHIACLCSVSDDEMMFLVLKNNDTFSMSFRYNFTLNTLSEDSTHTMRDEMPLSDADIIYNIFLNPDTDTVTVNDTVQTVNTIEYNEHNIGFWWSEID